MTSRTAKFRSNMKRAREKICANGELKIEKITDPAKILNSLGFAIDISRKSWKGKTNSDMAGNDNSQEFFKLLSEVCGEKGWIVLWLLYLNEKPIAMQYQLFYENKAYLLRTDFDEEFKEYSPGTVFRSYVIEDYDNTKIKEYDLCGMDYFYKMRLTDLIREHKAFYIFNDRFISKSIYRIENYVIPMLRKLKNKFQK